MDRRLSKIYWRAKIRLYKTSIDIYRNTVGEVKIRLYKTSIHLRIDLTQGQYDYIESCSRIRGVTRYRIITKLIRMIANDQLVLSILDDEDKYRTEYAKKKISHHKKNVCEEA